MHLQRISLIAASVLTLSGAALANGAAAATTQQTPQASSVKATMNRSKSILLNEKVATAGVYAVTVAVTSHTSANQTVNLTIGNVTRRAVTSAHSRSVTVRANVTVTGSVLTIRAARAAATITASWKRAAKSTTHHHGSTSGSSGSTGLAGVTTPIVPANVPAPTAPTGSTAPSGSTGSTGSTATSGPPGDPSTWHTILDDEFTNGLNSSIWNTTRFNGGGLSKGFNSAEQECLDPAETTFANGEADLNLITKTESCDGETNPYAGSVLDTDGKWSYTYGYLEARVWVPSVNGQVADWPAVWAVGDNWPAGGEVDVMEGLSGQACWHFHDPQGGPGGCAAGNYTGGWHTFGADWEPGSVTYYYDGQAVGTINSGITNSPMQLILDVAIAPGSPVQVPATMRVDYVRVYQHNS